MFKTLLSVDEFRISLLGVCLLTSIITTLVTAFVLKGGVPTNLLHLDYALITGFTGVSGFYAWNSTKGSGSNAENNSEEVS